MQRKAKTVDSVIIKCLGVFLHSQGIYLTPGNFATLVKKLATTLRMEFDIRGKGCAEN